MEKDLTYRLSYHGTNPYAWKCGRESCEASPCREAVLKWERLGTLRVALQDAVEYDCNKGTYEGAGAQWQRN